MCGILFILLQNGCEDLNMVRDGFLSLKNRGPDRGKLSITTDYISGFQRLCINDLSLAGDQPFVSETGNLLQCNGEIFNYQELLAAHSITCSSNSDCEVILHLFEKIGITETVKSLNGDYAFCLNTKSHVYMVRDISGVRPLFYGKTYLNNLCVASTAKSLLNFSKDVYEVPPGITCYDKQTCKFNSIERFLPIEKSLDANSFENILIKSVKDRLLSDRPIGCLLSGGLDSSLIASILCKLIGPENVRTYSIGFENSNDLINATNVSNYLKTQHTNIVITENDVISNLNNIIFDLESYDITTIRASAPMWLLAKYISFHTNDIVLFSGEGADELFCGYLYFHYAPNNEELIAERKRLYESMYKYDCLRADRCVSSHGLELRVPFLDKEVIRHAFSLNADCLNPSKNNNIEKFYIRNEFKNNYLPDDILWRRKDGFSDGVTSTLSKPWYSVYNNSIYDTKKFPSSEAQTYKSIYDMYFLNFDLKTPYWMPKWIETNGDPSGRKLAVFSN